MNKFLVSLCVLFTMLCGHLSHAATIKQVDKNGNVRVVEEESWSQFTPEQDMASEKPGTIVPVYVAGTTFERTSFWYGRTVKKASKAVVFKDGKMQNVSGEYRQEDESVFLWYVPLGILAMILMVMVNMLARRCYDWCALAVAIVAFVVTATVASIVVVGSFADTFVAPFLVAVFAAFVITDDIAKGKDGGGKLRLSVFCTAMTIALLWNLW